MHPVRVPLRAVSRPVPGEQFLNVIFLYPDLNIFFSKPHWMSPRVSTTKTYSQNVFWLD